MEMYPGLTTDNIGQDMGYRSPNYIGHLLRGHKPINTVFLEKLKEDYSVNPQWILTGNGEMMLHYEAKKAQGAKGRPGQKSKEIDYQSLYIESLQNQLLSAQEDKKYFQKLVQSNLDNATRLLQSLAISQAVHDDVMMSSLERLEKKPEGTLAGESDRRERKMIEDLVALSASTNVVPDKLSKD